MLISLSSAISGLKNFQTKMDAIGNNIANTETPGFKKSVVTFKDTLYQSLSGASAPTDERGGINGKSLGMGMSIAAITVDHSQTSASSTSSVTDMAIDGTGYFILNNGGTQVYTRNGNFQFDESGNLHNTDGLYVQGWMADPDNDYNISTNGVITNINIAGYKTIPAVATTKVIPDGNLDSDLTASVGYDLSDPDNPVAKAFDKDNDTPEDANAIVKSVVVYDSLGNEYTVYMRYFKAATTVTTEGAVTESEWYCDISLDPTFSATPVEYSGSTSVGSGDLIRVTGIKFDTAGHLDTAGTGQVELVINGAPAGADNIDFTMDLSGMTQYNTDSSVTLDQNGIPAGNLRDYTVDSSGVISGIYDNGYRVTLAQVALANFQNPSGLTQLGGTLFGESNNSGVPQIGAAGTNGMGTVLPSSLEMSNVDLAQEFTEMITTQRAFQSASRIITTSDQMLEELVNLKR